MKGGAVKGGQPVAGRGNKGGVAMYLNSQKGAKGGMALARGIGMAHSENYTIFLSRQLVFGESKGREIILAHGRQRISMD